nr:ORF_PT4 [Ostreid herpesvirus 1]
MSRYDNMSRPELNLFLDPDHVTKTTRHRQIIDYLEKLGCGGNDYKEEIDFLVRQNALFSSLPKEEYRHYLLVTYSFLQGLGYSSTSMKSLMENISNTIEGSITATPFDVVGKQYYQGKYIINPMQDLSRGDTCLLVDKNDINMISSRLRGEKGKKMMMLVFRIFSDIMTRNENVIETHAKKNHRRSR